jgi:ATP-binding cassette, subfamily B, bacterial
VALFEDPERLNVLQTAQQAIPRLQGLSMTLGNLLNGLFAFAPVFLLSFSIAWWVPLVIFATAVPSILAQARYEKRTLDMEFSQAPRYRRMDLQGRVLTGPEYATELRLFGLQELFLSRWRSLFWSAYEDVRAVRRRGALVVVGLSLVSGLGAGLPYVYVVAEAFRGAFTPGGLALYAGLVFQVRRSLFVLVANAADLQERALGSAAIFRLLDLRPTLRDATVGRDGGTKLREPRRVAGSVAPESGPATGGLRIEGVRFSYPGSAVEALAGVDLSIGPGETVVLVGENGAGKTTLAKLLCRLYDPDGAAITWDGTDLRDLDLGALRARIVVLNQDHARFPATAEENIAFGLPEGGADEDAVREAAEGAGIAGAIGALPEGYGTPLSKQMEGGVDLSGGQWQRVALARAILRGAPDPGRADGGPGRQGRARHPDHPEADDRGQDGAGREPPPGPGQGGRSDRGDGPWPRRRERHRPRADGLGRSIPRDVQ